MANIRRGAVYKPTRERKSWNREGWHDRKWNRHELCDAARGRRLHPALRSGLSVMHGGYGADRLPKDSTSASPRIDVQGLSKVFGTEIEEALSLKREGLSKIGRASVRERGGQYV